MKKVKVKLVKSLIGKTERQKNTVKALGLGRMNSEKVHELTPQIKGMIDKVSFMLDVEEIEG